MPLKEIDYSNTIIYKLCCNDPSITEVYVGHTTNFTRRKQQHKQACNIETNKCYNLYVYQFIRDNGGWTNWSMIEICKVDCIDSNDARKNERQHIELLGATLNKVIPTRTCKEYYIDNKSVILENVHKYNEENREHINNRQIEYRKNNYDIVRQRDKEYRENNRTKRCDVTKKWYQKNKDIILEKKKQYRDANKEILNEKQRLRRELLKSEN